MVVVVVAGLVEVVANMAIADGDSDGDWGSHDCWC